MSTVIDDRRVGSARVAIAARWSVWLPAFALVVGLGVVFWRTALDMVAMWNLYASYTHAWLVPPIVLWLVWRRRARLFALPVKPLPWLALPIGFACAVWLGGDLMAMNAPTQFAFVTVAVLAVPALFGWAVARALLFPLSFLYFSVPFGEFMVGPMMDWTADFTVLALQLSGVPVYREGLQFVIPSGTWSVIEACSGVRYLTASFMVGTLFAYLNYRSPWRRATFVFISLLVPVAANWVRAYLIVMLGHLTDNRLAAGVDHLVYGWLFFGVVIGLMFMIGARWAEPVEATAAASPAVPVASANPLPVGRLWLAAVAVLLVLAAADRWHDRVEQPSGRGDPHPELPVAAGWTAELDVGDPHEWVPHWPSANTVLRARLTPTMGPAQADGAVQLWLGAYRDQNSERKLVTSIHGFVQPGAQREWVVVAAARQAVALPGGEVLARAALIQREGAIGGRGEARLEALQLYWVGGRWTASPVWARVWLAWDRLRGQGDDSAVVVLYRQQPADAEGNGSDPRSPPLTRAAQALLPAVGAALAAEALPRGR